MNNYTEIESLEILIKAVGDYQTELDVNRQILINAANLCDAAMGSDDIAKKHIQNLNNALTKLASTSQLAASVAEALAEDKQRAWRAYYGE